MGRDTWLLELAWIRRAVDAIGRKEVAYALDIAPSHLTDALCERERKGVKAEWLRVIVTMSSDGMRHEWLRIVSRPIGFEPELRDQSNELVASLDEQARGAQLDALDGAQVELHSSTHDLIALNEHSSVGTSQVDAGIRDERQQALLGTHAGASPYLQSEAATAAGEVALRSRITAARDALIELQLAADHAFGSDEKFRFTCPDLKTPANLVADVRDRLSAIEQLWIQAQRDGTPVVQVDQRAPDGWGEWQGRAYGLAAARKAFARIAGDKDLRDFIHEVRERVHHAELIQALVHLVEAVAIAIVTSGIASSAGATVSAAIREGAAESLGAAVAADGTAVTATAGQQVARFAVEAAAFTSDIAVNASLNAAVQLAQSGAPGEAGSTFLENALMDVFSRGLLRPLRAAQTIANNEARALATLPGLADGERSALLASAEFAGTPAMLDMVTGAASQWAAHRLVTTFRGGADASSSFAEMALMQGAAIAVGKFFHGRVAAWHEHRTALESSKRGQLPAAKALFAARDAFYADAARLATDPAPDPNAGAELQARNQALIEQERALLAGNRDSAHAIDSRDPRSGGARIDQHEVAAREQPSAEDGANHHRDVRAAHDPVSKWREAWTTMVDGRVPPRDSLPDTLGNHQGLARLADIHNDATIPEGVREEFMRDFAERVSALKEPPENLFKILTDIVYSHEGRTKYQRKGTKIPNIEYVRDVLGGLRRLVALRALCRPGMLSREFYARTRKLDLSLPDYQELDWDNGAQQVVDVITSRKIDFSPDRDLLPTGMIEGRGSGDSGWFFAGRDADVSDVSKAQSQLAIGGAYLNGYVVLDLPAELALPDPSTGHAGASRPTALDLTLDPLGKLNPDLHEPVGRTSPQSPGQAAVREVVVSPVPLSAMSKRTYVSSGAK